MPTGHIMMAMSLDGFVARADHSLDWLEKQQTEGEDHGFAAFMESVDAIVMGSGSLRTVLGFGVWPYEKPVIVLSRSMVRADIPEHLRTKVELSQLGPVDLMDHLDGRGMSRIYVDGGAVIQSFLAAGLIADMRVTVVPILIGAGVRMFGELTGDIDLALDGVDRFPSGLVTLRYSVNA